MPSDREQLTTFFFLLTRDYLGWGEVQAIIDESLLVDPETYADSPGETVAREMAERLLGPVSAAMGHLDAESIIAYDLERDVQASAEIHACIRSIAGKPHRAPLYLADLLRDDDLQRRETLRDVAQTLVQLRDKCEANDLLAEVQRERVNAMIDRCNLAALPDGGVVYSKPARDYPATDAEICRLRRFEDGVTELLGVPVTGTDAMLERLRERLSDGPWVVCWSETSGKPSALGHWHRLTIDDYARHLASIGYDPITRLANMEERREMETAASLVCLHHLQADMSTSPTGEWTLIDSEASAQQFVSKTVHVLAPEIVRGDAHFFRVAGTWILDCTSAEWLHLTATDTSGDQRVAWKDRGNVSLRLAEVDQ